MVNRLQPFIHLLISEQQSALFLEGKYTITCISVAHEVFHFLKHKKSGKKGDVAVKLDLNKAYDWICWDFLIKVLEKMRFSPVWTGWVKECVCPVTYSYHCK